MKKKLKWIIITISIILSTIFITKFVNSMEEKNYYLCTMAGPERVNNYVEDGYKVIGRYKLQNPKPRAITYSDEEFIIAKLPEWLAEHYPKCKLSEDFVNMRPTELLIKMKYAFTLLNYKSLLEADFYILNISDGKDKRKIYITKAVKIDGNFAAVENLIYPFFDEEWHSNIDDDKPYECGDLW